MTIDLLQIANIIGLLINLGAMVGYAMKFERRFTTLEVHVHYLREDINKIPRRISDGHAVD